MKRIVKLLLSSSVIILIASSCEKRCICRNLDNGASYEAYGLYSKKDCEKYGESQSAIYQEYNIECTMDWR